MWNWKIIWKWAIYRNINSLVTSHFGRGFFDGKQMINVSICSWYSLIDLERESECVKRKTGALTLSQMREREGMRMIHFSKPFFFVTITKRLRVIRVWVCVSLQVCLFVVLIVYFSLSLFVCSQGTCPFASVLSICFLFLFLFLLSVCYKYT